MATLTRKNVSLRTQELEVVARVRDEGSPEREALRDAFGVELPERVSEAESLRVVLKVGLRAIEEKIMDNGYAELAASQTDEDASSTRAVRDRGARYTD